MVKCHDCPQMYHASCAWNKGFKFQFDIQPVSLLLRLVFQPRTVVEYVIVMNRQRALDETARSSIGKITRES